MIEMSCNNSLLISVITRQQGLTIWEIKCFGYLGSNWPMFSLPLPQLRLSSVLLTLAGTDRVWQGRTVQILVSLFSLHWEFLLVIREETPMPQLREHWDQSVVWTGHLFSFRWFHTEDRRHERGRKVGRKRKSNWQMFAKGHKINLVVAIQFSRKEKKQSITT